MSEVPSWLLPEDEATRLSSLRSYDLLPALRETVFDELVALTARIFSLPISLIALVDEEHVFYKANYGMPGNEKQPRQEALCSTAILHDKAVVYQDLEQERNPLITVQAAQAARTNQLRFYAGAPLRMPNQQPIGTLCIIDRQPRVFSKDEQRMLEKLAAVVSHTVAVRQVCRTQPDGERRWKMVRLQLQEEVQALRALVRYLLTRYGTTVPVPPALLTQFERRLPDLHELLDQYQYQE
ncbi:GAF domain protein [Hymenobacter roseosalivarius DSM 11622]|uniref:GAF domain protein n=1 Tax=Hymenobacter roseosalivarius DSM 11622 TaxID=645990 RepID=A0A1W1W0J9_9BACT|nr:GAF domain-containing protein [Hymenobacter roseosalivarius]SMB98881.1 GAF domain protein [Hymenobacter roseosalivarius DSM 11622]